MSPFAREFAGKLSTFYTGAYRPSRVEAIKMAYAQYPGGQKMYRIELEQIAQRLGALAGETVQNWTLLLQQYLAGILVPLPICRADEKVDPVSRKCVAPAPKPPPTPKPEPPPTAPVVTPPPAPGAADKKGTMIVLAAAAIALMIVLSR